VPPRGVGTRRLAVLCGEWCCVPGPNTPRANQRAAAVIPSQLDGLRKKERLRALYRQQPVLPGTDDLAGLATIIGSQAGLDGNTALVWLKEFASAE